MNKLGKYKDGNMHDTLSKSKGKLNVNLKYILSNSLQLICQELLTLNCPALINNTE